MNFEGTLSKDYENDASPLNAFELTRILHENPLLVDLLLRHFRGSDNLCILIAMFASI